MKPLINFNIPRAGRITSDRLIGAAVVGCILIGAWNWSSRIPTVGPYADKAKSYVRMALGFAS